MAVEEETPATISMVQDANASAAALLSQLDERQDDVLQQLDELERQLAEVLEGLQPASSTDVSLESDATEDASRETDQTQDMAKRSAA
ncbi:MAG: hypothetical protein AAFN70_02740 [Planctomycetota bacterium]